MPTALMQYLALTTRNILPYRLDNIIVVYYLSWLLHRVLLLLLTMLYMLLTHPRRFVGHLSLLGVHHIHEYAHSSAHTAPSDVKVLQRFVHVCSLH